MHACCATAPCSLHDASAYAQRLAAKFDLDFLLPASVLLPLASWSSGADLFSRVEAEDTLLGIGISRSGCPEHALRLCAPEFSVWENYHTARSYSALLTDFISRTQAAYLDAGLLHDSLLRRTNDHVLRLRRR